MKPVLNRSCFIMWSMPLVFSWILLDHHFSINFLKRVHAWQRWRHQSWLFWPSSFSMRFDSYCESNLTFSLPLHSFQIEVQPKLSLRQPFLSHIFHLSLFIVHLCDCSYYRCYYSYVKNVIHAASNFNAVSLDTKTVINLHQIRTQSYKRHLS